jgi:hypothetical protein
LILRSISPRFSNLPYNAPAGFNYGDAAACVTSETVGPNLVGENLRSPIAVTALLFSIPPLTWIATGLLAGWLAARRGKSWRWGFALGFCFSTAGVALAAFPPIKFPRSVGKGIKSGQGQCGVEELAGT